MKRLFIDYGPRLTHNCYVSHPNLWDYNLLEYVCALLSANSAFENQFSAVFCYDGLLFFLVYLNDERPEKM